MKMQRRHDKRNQRILLQAQLEAQQALLDYHALLLRSNTRSTGNKTFDSVPAAIPIVPRQKHAG